MWFNLEAVYSFNGDPINTSLEINRSRADFCKNIDEGQEVLSHPAWLLGKNNENGLLVMLPKYDISPVTEFAVPVVLRNYILYKEVSAINHGSVRHLW